jgi:lipoyl(octanoyl) transferase
MTAGVPSFRESRNNDVCMKLETLRFWHDVTPRCGALNMAIDEAVLELAEEPWLRVYHWHEPTISIGYSQPLSLIPESRRGWPVVRRWTGGGVVEHNGDWTYTLAVPSRFALSDQRAVETYRWIHEAMIAALSESGISGCSLQPESASDGMGVCFDEPARFDVVHDGRKVAGAAQRRSRAGLLHQGTIQPLKPPADFDLTFAGALATGPVVVSQEDALRLLLNRAEILAAEKYGAASWLEDRRALKG